MRVAGVAVGLLLAMMFAASGTSVAAPSPSPSLDSVLVTPASDYVGDTDPSIPLQGNFTLQEYVSYLTATDQAYVQRSLQRYGFVSGFAHTWRQTTSSHLVMEVVIAFAGGYGARHWLTLSEASDKGDPTYVRAIPVSGITPGYAWHSANPSVPDYADLVMFVKGNDFFMIVGDSAKDDLGDLAITQSEYQYRGAPAYTIAPSQWPENAARSQPAWWDLGAHPIGPMLPWIAIVVVIVAGAIGRAARRRSPALHVSPDGRYWWDGHAWRDAATEIPPTAQRSPDGHYWWDGRTWRAVQRPPS